MSTEIEVHADWEGIDSPRLMGVLRAIESKGKEVFSFTYDKGWLSANPTTPLDPDLKLYGGPQYVAPGERTNFGTFLDSCPDRWGRLLMRRREAALAWTEQREPRRLGEVDYLLGVHDAQRVGGLRFRLDASEAFLSDESDRAAPPWTSLRQLENASWHLQDADREPDEVSSEWLQLLIAPGSSLGGARPKAGVRDPQDDLWIAKFPARNDDADTGAWEWVTWELARQAGLAVPDAKLLKLDRDHHTFLSRRFDRSAGTGGRGRLHFASAMTMLGYSDGSDHQDGASYLELADFINNQGSQPAIDLEELWRRIVFSICVSNTDDHLRNHGFLLADDGWSLAPAYDLNPNPQGRGLSLNISENSNALDPELALEMAPHFRLDETTAGRILTEVRKAVAGWEKIAKGASLSRGEIEDMRPAFRTTR